MEPRYRYSKVRVTLLVLVLLSIFGGGGYLAYQKFFSTSQSDPEDVVALINKVAEVPVGETPVISIVANLDALQGQPFFKDAQVGDRVLVYQEARMAYLFRLSTGKVVSISPIAE